MPRLLWLAYERLPHPDAVSYPAGEADAELVLELFSHPYPVRRRIAQQLRNFLREQTALPVWNRKSVPCRRKMGLYQLIPWRLAKWLAMVLTADDAVTERTRRRIRHWLENGDRPQVVTPPRPAS